MIQYLTAIETRYLGPTNMRGSRIVATTGDRVRLIVPYDYNADRPCDAHAKAALALCNKMGWDGDLIGGHTRSGMCWVFANKAVRDDRQ